MKKILVIDDEKSVCEMLAKFLTKKGYQAFEAQNAKDALAIITEERPHVTLLDIRMPDMNGVELLAEIRKIDREMGVIMITAVKEEETARKCMELGAYDYITKPFELDYLENALLLKLLNFDTEGS